MGMRAGAGGSKALTVSARFTRNGARTNRANAQEATVPKLITDDGVFEVSEDDLRRLDETRPRYRPDGDPLEALTDHDAPLDAALDRQEGRDDA